MHVPAVRRHQPRLPQRPGRAGQARPAWVTMPNTSTCATSARSTPRSRGRPATMRVTTHMCRGNFRSSWAAEGGYDFVAEALFSELAVDGFFLEYDDARSGGFEPLRFVPKGQAGRARPRHDEAPRAREQGRSQAPHRRSREVRAPRPAVSLARSAASRRPSRATCSPTTTRSPSSASSSTWRTRCGADLPGPAEPAEPRRDRRGNASSSGPRNSVGEELPLRGGPRLDRPR